jgi:hypothetical protein
MIYSKEVAIRTIVRALAYIKVVCEQESLLHLMNSLTVSEHFFCSFLNEAYGLDLVNLNQITPNYAAIDLGDKNAQVSFQVTKDGKAGKIQKTLDTFVKHSRFNDYKKLRFLVFGDRQSKYTTLKVDSRICFTWSDDIIGISELNSHLDRLPVQQLERLAKIVEQEITIGSAVSAASLHGDKQALEFYRRHFDRPWMQDDWRSERNFADFHDRAVQAISLLNAGVIDANEITKSRHDFKDTRMVDGLEDIYHKVRKLLSEFCNRSRPHDQNREIDLATNRCQFRIQATYGLIDAMRQDITDTLNPLLTQAGLRPVRGVLR